MPEFQPHKAPARHGFLHRLTGIRILEGIDGRDVLEHERQIENLKLLGKGFELRQRGGRELYVALQHRLQHRVIIIKRGVRKHLHTGLAVHFGVHAVGKHLGGNPLWVLVRVGDVSELHHDFAFVAACAGKG